MVATPVSLMPLFVKDEVYGLVDAPVSVSPLFVQVQIYQPSVLDLDMLYIYKQSIHNQIVETIKQGIFLPVTYDPDTKLMILPDDESDAIPPASLAANELTCLFGLPERNRRERVMERNTWRWQAIVKFHREVVLEVFEEALLAAPILIERDAENGLRQVTINLIDADYVHPPKQSPSSGTQVVYTFEARLGPV